MIVGSIAISLVIVLATGLDCAGGDVEQQMSWGRPIGGRDSRFHIRPPDALGG
jgi:hypothetical protein